MSQVLSSEPERLRSFKPHGIICQLFGGVPGIIAAVRAVHVPVVELCNAITDMAVPRVMPDAAAEGECAATHLIGRGFAQLVYIGDSCYGQHIGFTRAARAAGCSATVIDIKDPHLLSEPEERIHRRHFVHDDMSPLRRAWAHKFFSECRKPVGVHTISVEWAVDVIEGCQEAGILVPEQVAVVTSTTYPKEGQAFPLPLTSIASNYEQQGYLAAQLLDQMLHGKKVAADTVIGVPPLPIEERESTMCYATDNLPVARAATLIMRNLYDPNLTAKQVCLDKGVSRCVLYRDFRDHFKMPVARYIEHLRIKNATAMLVQTDASSESIASSCGFGEALRFRRAFNRATGMAPHAYRKKHRTDTA